MWHAFYAGVTLACTCIAFSCGGYVEKFAESLLVVLYVFTNTCHWLLPHNVRDFFPIADEVSAIILFGVWLRTKSILCWMLSMTFLIEIVWHAAYFSGADTFDRRYGYDVGLNLLYLLQQALVVRAVIARDSGGLSVRELRRGNT